MMPVGAVISAITSNVLEAAIFTTRRECQLDSIDILLRYSAGRLAAMEKKNYQSFVLTPVNL